jgi:hypothetical protein
LLSFFSDEENPGPLVRAVPYFGKEIAEQHEDLREWANLG